MDRVVTVVPEAGLHARPAARFVRTANEFECDLSIARADGSGDAVNARDDAVNARSMLAVTGLGVECGESVRLTARGDDAEAALDALEAVLTTEEVEE